MHFRRANRLTPILSELHARSSTVSVLASIYIHFPWCLAKCPYCDFVSFATPREDIDHRGYADAVLREARARAEQWATHALREPGGSRGAPRIASIFFGGGTPSLWHPAELGRVLEGLRRIFELGPDVEVTVECNPTSLDAERADQLESVGVTRLSIGTQSLRAEQLQFLGRLHDPNGALDALAAAASSRISRLSTDMIFGLPGQSARDAQDQAEFLADFRPERLGHLSCYQLTIEPGTQFGERKKRGLLPAIDDGRVADAFVAIDEALTSRGFVHYEISNYARPSEESRHNLGYWKGEEYIGLGCAAFGFARTPEGGLRLRNPLDPSSYVEATRSIRADVLGEGDGCTFWVERLRPLDLLRERLMLGLRLREGVDLSETGRDLGVDPWTESRRKSIEWLLEHNRLVQSDATLRIPHRAWLFADDTAARLF